MDTSPEYIILPDIGDETQTPCIGDYVLCTRWGDRDSHDPWAVGLLSSVEVYPANENRRYPVREFQVEGSERTYRHVWKISPDQGKYIVDTFGEKDGMAWIHDFMKMG